MIACAPTGLIYYLSPSYNGSLNDKSVIDLEENQIYQELSKYEWMAVDLGYRGVQNDYPNTAFPFFERTVTLEPLLKMLSCTSRNGRCAAMYIAPLTMTYKKPKKNTIRCGLWLQVLLINLSCQ
jgi:hypothetical protein